MHIYRAVYGDDSVCFIEAESLKAARFIAERLGDGELWEIGLAWTAQDILLGKNSVTVDHDGGSISFMFFGIMEYHDLYNDASV